MSGTIDGLPMVLFEGQRQMEDWLEQHHEASAGIWVQIAKKASGITSISYQEALEIALCYGWIDSRKEKLNDELWIQRFTPRGARSIWSKVNVEKAERLIEQNRMKTAGLRAIETAKQNGQWAKAYAPQSTSELPEDFADALARNEKAGAFFEALDKQNRYAMIFRIHNAKKAETRMKRIAQFVDMLEKGERIYPK
ncbi:YdeI/OmpD-associated family protein [Paenibacillus sacheonensis]|uniref:Bacteriocin-protection protein n=1 Tax=Paenibacillus sacheonensis TaxID=742054 RepID=A0A7X4YKV4_9BACL|nr:YdeI/OmpD-associated family protein [Paenibacillus sacheonensis]MBM7563164.1 uncharacterized protein YdeI (YjbR/CyaY-like superfamily) [Paenibacillus sacheonensis]NBC68273.1 bacteriocin-protection protein [Paenibacillus sacheonensis]